MTTTVDSAIIELLSDFCRAEPVAASKLMTLLVPVGAKFAAAYPLGVAKDRLGRSVSIVTLLRACGYEPDVRGGRIVRFAPVQRGRARRKADDED